jgi:hypothetical protein
MLLPHIAVYWRKQFCPALELGQRTERIVAAGPTLLAATSAAGGPCRKKRYGDFQIHTHRQCS